MQRGCCPRFSKRFSLSLLGFLFKTGLWWQCCLLFSISLRECGSHRGITFSWNRRREKQLRPLVLLFSRFLHCIRRWGSRFFLFLNRSMRWLDWGCLWLWWMWCWGGRCWGYHLNVKIQIIVKELYFDLWIFQYHLLQYTYFRDIFLVFCSCLPVQKNSILLF